MFNWLTSEELTTISLAPGETRLQRLKFIIAFFAATVAAKRARDENERTAQAVEFGKAKDPEFDPKSYTSSEWTEVDPSSAGLNTPPRP